MSQNSSSAVMQQRHEAPDAADDFPTPCWSTRAALQVIRGFKGCGDLSIFTAREPCANRGYMVRPMEEFFAHVYASDVHDYGSGYPLLDYLFPGPMIPAHWTLMNPPFVLATDFILRSFETPDWVGTAALVRTSFLEGQGRYAKLFSVRPPTIVAQHVERVIMHKGIVRDPGELYWDGAQWKKPSTATSYAWLIWCKGIPPQPFHWIPPCRKRLERPGDYLPPSPIVGRGPTCQKSQEFSSLV